MIAPHEIDAVAQLAVEEGDLALPDAVLAGAGAVHRDSPEVEPRDEFFGPRDLGGIVDIHQHQRVEIAVSDMADDRRDQAYFGNVGFRLGDAFGKP